MSDTNDRLDRYEPFPQLEQAIDALEIVLEQLERVPSKPRAWKWAVTALHDALHGFMGAALRGSHGAQLLTPKAERSTYERGERERELRRPLPPEPGRVDLFLNLYEKVKNPARMRHYDNSRALAATGEQDQSVAYLNRLRNDLTHYSDTVLLVNVAELPEIVSKCLSVIAFLVRESHTILFYPYGLESKANELLDQLEEAAIHLTSQYRGE